MSLSENMTVISVTWFCEMGQPRPIGIVLAEYNDTKIRKAFIGTGLGFDAEEDTLHIIDCGAKLLQSQVQNLNNELLVKPQEKQNAAVE